MSDHKLVSITSEDLSRLINFYEQADNLETTFETLCHLRSYQRCLQDPERPQHIELDVLTVNNDWAEDGLCLIVVS